jgi:LPXTG-motif cell wall-anchored protein
MSDGNDTSMPRTLLLPFMAVLLACTVVAVPAGAMTNPAAGYCTALGYEYVDIIGTNGAMTGHCMLPGNRSVDAWQFLKGNVSPELSYCKKAGLEIRTVRDPRVCGLLGSTCGVCVKADGSTQEVTAMMGLDFREKICSGKICCDPAKNMTCPIASEGPVVKSADGTLIVLTGIIGILIIGGAGWYFLRKRNAGRGQ